MEGKEYAGSCYIGVVGPETEIGECRDSIDSIVKQPNDIGPFYTRATKGYEARQLHFKKWMENTDCAFMLLLDSDMIFPKNTLERLRSHKLPYISGTYMRRTFAPPAPVWFGEIENDQFPYRPYTGKMDANMVYRVGASGWGCILVHRDVPEAMRPILKGEELVIEDDMDLYPYDLNKIMVALDVLDNMTKQDGVTAKALRGYVDVLRSEIKPLRGVKDLVGSDIRFPFYAKKAGFDLYLDTGVMCGHMVNYPVTPFDFLQTPDDVVAELTRQMGVQVKGERVKLEKEINYLNAAKVPQNEQAERIEVKNTHSPSEVEQ